ncbi:MAG: class I SAM-dependent methyltransferase [Planctomycetota bacterium]
MGRFFRDRFGFKSSKEVERFFTGKLVLDAGIGSGQNENHFGRYARAIVGFDISKSVDAAYKHWNGTLPLFLVQADIFSLPFEDNTFDIVISDGVLHHTPDTRKALVSITRKVKAGGYVMFYVYRKKGPVREFVDDEIRRRIAHLSNEESWKALEPLTLLAKQLSRQKIKIKVPEDISLLEIPKGNYDLQRFLYWYMMKFYWNEALNFDENNNVNFDWYRPFYAHRQTPDEVKGWLNELFLKPIHFNIGDSGITVIAKKAPVRTRLL